MKQPKIAIVTLGHYIYFQQFEDLRAELVQKTNKFIERQWNFLYQL